MWVIVKTEARLLSLGARRGPGWLREAGDKYGQQGRTGTIRRNRKNRVFDSTFIC